MEKFIEFNTLMEKQKSASIKILRTDRRGEYLSNTFKDHLKENGIIHQLTVAHTPQQNGVAERRNRTLIEATRCLLDQSGLSWEFWTDAIMYSTHIRNRVPSKLTHGMMPYELWNNRKPTQEHLRAFGCEAWYKTKERTHKLEPKGIPCIMLGYSPESKAYIVFDVNKKARITTRDIIFNEEVFPKVNRTIPTHE